MLEDGARQLPEAGEGHGHFHGGLGVLDAHQLLHSAVSYPLNVCRIDPRWRCDRAMTRRPVRARWSRSAKRLAQRCVRVPSLDKEPQERSAVRCARDDLVWSCSRRRTNGRGLPLATVTDRGLFLSHQDPPAWIDNLVF